MATVSDELVERVAHAIEEDITRRINDLFDNAEPKLPPDKEWVNGEGKAIALAAIAALSTPEFVLPLAEEMLRGLRGTNKANPDVWFYSSHVLITRGMPDEQSHSTLLDAYRAAKGE